MTITTDELERLVEAAILAQANAYAPYSKFAVGAALLTENNRLFSGCNVENSSFGLSVCAERHAVAAMVMEAEHTLRAVAVCSRGGVKPCGACCQVIAEFGTELDVVLFDSDKQVVTEQVPFRSLFPSAFRFEA